MGEKEFLDEVEICLKENGCQTWREVIPDACENWEHPYQVDLIFYRDDFGYIGCEGKLTNTMRGGGRVSKAAKQIEEKYHYQTYFKGNIIDKWCIIIPLVTGWENIQNKELSNAIKEEVIIFLRGFLKNSYGISLLEYHIEDKWRKSRVDIDVMTPQAIHIGGESKYDRREV